MAYGLVAWLVAGEPRRDTAHEEIATEMRAFYADLDGARWSAMLDHFLPAKVTARWSPPEESMAWTRLLAPPATAGSSGGCGPRLAVAVVGEWARVLARRCGGAVDEAWMLRVGGRWKIVHLVLGTEGETRSAAAPGDGR
jgi:hypothetical protein